MKLKHLITFCAIPCMTLWLTACSLFTFAPEYPEFFPKAWEKMECRTRIVREIVPGVTYYYWHFDDFEDTGKPVSLHLVLADWDKTDYRVSLKVMASEKNQLAGLHELAGSRSGDLLAAVNGCYFDPRKNNQPQFTLKAGQKVVPGAANAPCALIANTNDLPEIVPMSDKVLKNNENVIQGHQLAVDGRSVFTHSTGGGAPYSAVGVDRHNRMVYFLTVDGYHDPKIAPGIGFSDVTGILISLGAKNVMSLSSDNWSTMVVRNEDTALPEVVNYPSGNRKFDHEGVAPLSNGIGLFLEPVKPEEK